MTEPRIHAPELPDHLEWLNTTRPVKLAEQRGRVVLLDFWTYCCINCLHVLQDLSYLEEKYPDGLTVVGIHSPKFPHERVGAHVQKAINRHGIRHPVANDPELTVWQQYGVRAWPSIIFIDPEGYVLGVLRGEGRRRQLDMLVAEHLEKAEQHGLRQRQGTGVEIRPEPQGPLAFPGKVLAGDGRLFISDSGHHRVLEADLDGRVLHVFGSGRPGLADGRGEQAQLREPQGLARCGSYLYVADTGNHAVRRIALDGSLVETIAGTGEQGRGPGGQFAQASQARLNSPWDVAVDGETLYIAMAGAHQIWRMDLATNAIGAFAGSGREDLADGAAAQAALAQPSGLALGDGALYFADSETSAVRAVTLGDGSVRTLVGKGLFEFGDIDGSGAVARLQHPLGVAFDGARETVWVADTYNDKVRRLDLRTGTVVTVPMASYLAEPGGLSVQGDTLWIANTNAHQVLGRAIDGAAEWVLNLRL